MKNLITLGVLFAIVLSAEISTQGSVAMCEESLFNFYGTKMTIALRRIPKKPEPFEQIKNSFRVQERQPVNKSSPPWLDRSNHLNTGPSKLNHRRLMSALITLSLLSRRD